MSYPAVLYRNLLENAENGRGDGTIYAAGDSIVTGGIDQDARTFEASYGTGDYTVMDDLTDADDLFNGHILRFDSSERIYHVEDYEKPVVAPPSGAIFTTRETPNLEDTGSFKVLRTLYTNDFATANPISKAVNGRLYDKWIDKAADNDVQIYAAAPNGVDDGGAELNSLTDFWTAGQSGGSTGAVSVSVGAALLGTYGFLFDRGDRDWIMLSQAGKIGLRKGYTYGMIFKSQLTSGSTQSNLGINLRYAVFGDSQYIPNTFTKINANDTLSSQGNGTNNNWKPEITTTAEWDEVAFTVSEDLKAGDWKLALTLNVSTNDHYVDEIYLWEIGPTPADNSIPNPDTLIIAGHNMAGGFANFSSLRGLRCPDDLTGQVDADDGVNYIDLDASVQVDGNSPIMEIWTAKTAIYPITRIQFEAVSGKTWEAAEIWVGPLWTWTRKPNPPLHGKGRKIEANRTRSRGGIKVSERLYKLREYAGQINLMDSDEADLWTAFSDEVGEGKPFFLITPADTTWGITSEVVFASCKIEPDIRWGSPVNYMVRFDFEEAL